MIKASVETQEATDEECKNTLYIQKPQIPSLIPIRFTQTR